MVWNAALTTEVEVVVAGRDDVGRRALLGLAGRHHLIEQAALSGAEGSTRRVWTCHYIVDTNAQVFHKLHLVTGVPDVTWRRGDNIIKGFLRRVFRLHVIETTGNQPVQK